jgi:hypothetical protein
MFEEEKTPLNYVGNHLIHILNQTHYHIVNLQTGVQSAEIDMFKIGLMILCHLIVPFQIPIMFGYTLVHIIFLILLGFIEPPVRTCSILLFIDESFIIIVKIISLYIINIANIGVLMKVVMEPFLPTLLALLPAIAIYCSANHRSLQTTIQTESEPIEDQETVGPVL